MACLVRAASRRNPVTAKVPQETRKIEAKLSCYDRFVVVTN
jgi:hypothetical protein